MNLRLLHKISGSIILIYFIMHLGNHLAMLDSAEAHLQVMEWLRPYYQNTFVKVLLYAAIALQILSGLHSVFRVGSLRLRGNCDGDQLAEKQKPALVRWLQISSGVYIAFFIVNHLCSHLVVRFILNMDTNFYYAVSGIHTPPFQYLLVPYFFFSIASVFAHIGCFLYWHFEDQSKSLAASVLGGFVVGGGLISGVICLAMMGVFYPIEIPLEYRATYQTIE